MTKEVLNGTTYNYTYDAAGNIKTKTKSSGSGTDTYTYGNSNWRDLLTAYNGNSITYDAVGNPLTYYNGTTFTWVNGRRLATAVNTSTGLNNSYTYDADGLRLTKTVNGVEHKYIWQGGKLVCESWSGKYLEFFYDENGAPYGFAYKSSPTAEQMRWYYILNQQGDVMAIVNSSGVIRATYTYNAYGEILSVNNLTTDNLGTLNPLRYRGYYYDSDTNLYYVKSRYYDPAICRFINADGLASTGQGFIGCNMFAYCGNNPVNGSDPTGEAWGHWAIAGAIVLLCAAATIITGGGFAGAAISVGLVANGLAATTTASTIAASAFIGSSYAVGFSAFIALTESHSVQDFANQGSWCTVINTGVGAFLGGLSGYYLARSQIVGSNEQNILSNKKLTNQTTKVQNYVSPTHGDSAAMSDFNSMNPTNVRTYNNGTIVGDLPNGCTINIHPSTSLNGIPTVEIYDPVSGCSIKIRY